MKKLHVFIKLVLISAIISLSPKPSFANGNYVRKLVITKKLNDDFSPVGDIDYRNDEDRLFRRHYEFGIDYNIKKDLILGARYRHIYLKARGEWDLSEQRPQLQITKKFNGKNLVYEGRIRHDYQIFDGDDKNRTRFRFKIISNRKLFNLKPVISDEFYYHINDCRLTQSRFEIGAILPTFSYFTPSLFFREDIKFDNKNRQWQADQIAVLRVDVLF